MKSNKISKTIAHNPPPASAVAKLKAKADRNASRKERKYAKAARTAKGRKMLKKRGVDASQFAGKNRDNEEDDEFGFDGDDDFDGVDFEAIEREMRGDLPSSVGGKADEKLLDLEDKGQGSDKEEDQDEQVSKDEYSDDDVETSGDMAVTSTHKKPQLSELHKTVPSKLRRQAKKKKKSCGVYETSVGNRTFVVANVNAVRPEVTEEAATFRSRLLGRHKRVPSSLLMHRQATFGRV